MDALVAELATYVDDADGDRYAETVFKLGLASARGAGNQRLSEIDPQPWQHE